jgi:hypothetical protein
MGYGYETFHALEVAPESGVRVHTEYICYEYDRSE